MTDQLADQIVDQMLASRPLFPKRSWDDMGNAARLADHHGEDIRWLTDAEQWAVYENGRWVVQGARTRVWTRVLQTINLLPDTEAFSYDDTPRTNAEGERVGPSERERFLNWAKRQRMKNRLAAMRDIAEGEPALHFRMSDFDRHPMLLNVRNGVVNLETGELLSHDRALYLMQQTPVVYDPNAQCPLWDRFLRTSMPEKERRDYLQRVAGYSITGSTAEQALFIHHGNGANGKSVFMAVIKALLGDYAQSVPRSTLLAKANEAISNDVARMLGKRMLCTSETSAGKRLDEELVKQLTGQEEISARFLHKEFFDFQPVGKIHLATNYLPHIGAGHGMARRLQDIGWDVTISEKDRIDGLADKIIASELPGVLNWAVRGCMQWQHIGLAVPESVKDKTAAHLRNSDPIAIWLSENTAATRDAYEETRLLFENYRIWAERSNVKPMTIMAFSLALEERGYEKANHPINRRSIFSGIRRIS